MYVNKHCLASEKSIYWLFWNRTLSQFQHICLGLNCPICKVFLHVCFFHSLTMNLRQNFVFYELCVHPVWFLISCIPSPSDLWSWDLSELPSVTQNWCLKKHTVSCQNKIVRMHKNDSSVLFLFIWKCYAMVFYVLQTVNICISKDIKCTEPTHLYLPDAFPTWRYKGCPSLLLCSFSIWKRQMLSLPLLTF